jgi:hypothetical protein
VAPAFVILLRQEHGHFGDWSGLGPPHQHFVRLDSVATHSTARADSNKRLAAKPLTKDEARQIAADIANLLELLRKSRR